MSQTQKEARQQLSNGKSPEAAERQNPPAEAIFAPRSQPINFGLTFADFPGSIPVCDMPLTVPFDFDTAQANKDGAGMINAEHYLSNVLEDEQDILFDRDSGHGSSVQPSPEGADESIGDRSPATTLSEVGSQSSGYVPVVRRQRKRRRRSSSSALSISKAGCPGPSLTSDLFSTTNNTLLTEGLLKIYQDSFENHLSCWLTERTCPYNRDSEVSLPNDKGPDWYRIYHRVFKLDRLSSVRGRSLSPTEDRLASKALNFAIFSFATQGAGSSRNRWARYPFHRDVCEGTDGNLSPDEMAGPMFPSGNPDAVLQVSAWHHARMALQEAQGIESFRVVLAQIVFSLTQKPCEKREPSSDMTESVADSTGLSQEAEEKRAGISRQQSTEPEDGAVDECADLLSKLNLAINADGPPVHLEYGLRLIHSLRSRMTMTGSLASRPKKIPTCWKHGRKATDRLEAGDRATVDLLFWLGIMFDTLSSAMNRRPLIVALEDRDLPATREAKDDERVPEKTPTSDSLPEDLWDDYLLTRQRRRLHRRVLRWPWSYEAASSILCDAAPLKVLLFRKVTRIQTMLSRRIQGERIEKAIHAALDVCEHWQRDYAPFIQDCVEHYDSLHWRVQSWSICLSAHWHLATLLLADLIEMVDESEAGVESMRRERASTNFLATFRQKNCYVLSDIARRACEENSFRGRRGSHFTAEQGALLTEPWTVVLIRAFATAGAILLESSATPRRDPVDQEDAFRRADDCVKALWYLGRKSAMALSAAKILGDVLRRRRKSEDMCSFLQNELWEGMDQMSEPFGAECV